MPARSTLRSARHRISAPSIAANAATASVLERAAGKPAARSCDASKSTHELNAARTAAISSVASGMMSTATPATTHPAAPFDATTICLHESMKHSRTPTGVLAAQAPCFARTHSDVARIASFASWSLPCGKWW